MKKNISFMLIVLLALSWYVSIDTYFGAPGEYQSHLEKAEKYEKKEIYEDAISEYEIAQGLLKERDFGIDLKIAHDYFKMYEYNDYVEYMEKIISSYEENEEAVIELSSYYVSDNKVPKAVELLKTEHEKHPDNQEISKALDSLKGTYTTIYANFLNISRIVYGYAVVESETGYGVIDSNGNTLISADYENVGIFGDTVTYAPVYADGKWSYVNKDIHKKLVPDKAYDVLRFFSEGKAPACRDGKYGYLNESMEEICEFEYEEVSTFYNGVAAVKKDGKWALIDDGFRLLSDFKYDDVIMDEFGYCSIGKRIFVKEGESCSMIDTKGHEVSELRFEDAYPFVASNQPAAVKQNGKWGFVDAEGKICIECTYDNAKSFSVDFAAVEKNGDWGYIDLENKLSIPCEFSDATPFYRDGTAAVKAGNQWGMIKLNIYQ